MRTPGRTVLVFLGHVCAEKRVGTCKRALELLKLLIAAQYSHLRGALATAYQAMSTKSHDTSQEIPTEARISQRNSNASEYAENKHTSCTGWRWSPVWLGIQVDK